MQRDLPDGQQKNLVMSSLETSAKHETEKDPEQDLMTPTRSSLKGASGSRSAEASSSRSADASGTRSAEASGSRSAEASGSRSAEASGSRSAEASGSRSAEASGSRSAEASGSRSAEASGSRSAEASGSRSAEASGSRSAEASSTSDLVSSNSSSIQDDPIIARQCFDLVNMTAQYAADASLQMQNLISRPRSFMKHVEDMYTYFCYFLGECSIDHACPITQLHTSNLRSRGAHNRTSPLPSVPKCGSKRHKRSKIKKRARDPDQTSSNYEMYVANIRIRHLPRYRNITFQRVFQLFRNLVLRFQFNPDMVEELYYLFNLYLITKKGRRIGYLPECSLRWSLLLRGYPDLAVLCSAILPRYYFIIALPGNLIPSNFTYPRYENRQFVRTLFLFNHRHEFNPLEIIELLRNDSSAEAHSTQSITATAIFGAIQIRSNLQIAASNHRNRVEQNYVSSEPLRLGDQTRSALSETVSHSRHRRLIQNSNSQNRPLSRGNPGSRSRTVSRSRNRERSQDIPVSRSSNRNVIVQEEASSQAQSISARIPRPLLGRVPNQPTSAANEATNPNGQNRERVPRLLLRRVPAQPTSAANRATNQNGQNRRYTLQSFTPVFRSSNNSLAHSSSSQNRASCQVIDVPRRNLGRLHNYYDPAGALRRYRHGVSEAVDFPEAARRRINRRFTMDYDSA